MKILNLGCSDKKESLSLHGGETFIYNSHKTWPGGVDYVGREVGCNRLSDILDDLSINEQIDLMSIDVEGWEMKVLNGIEDRHMPKLVIVEIDKSAGVHKEMLRRGYSLCHRDRRDAAYIKKGI